MTIEEQVRVSFGIGDRKLTSYERRFINAWTRMGFSRDAVALAVERECQVNDQPSLHYIDDYLERWHEKGLHSAEEVIAYEKACASECMRNKILNSAFDLRQWAIHLRFGGYCNVEPVLVEYSLKKKSFDIVSLGEMLERNRNTVVSVVGNDGTIEVDHLSLGLFGTREEAELFIQEYQKIYRLPAER